MKRITLFKTLDILKIPLIIGGILLTIYKFKGIQTNFGNTPLTNNLPTQKTSRSNAELQIIADIQESAMGDLGTNEELLFTSLEGLNADDLKEVANLFGKRNYAFGMRGGAFIGNTLNIFEWYAAELSNRQLSKMQDIWKKTGITF